MPDIVLETYSLPSFFSRKGRVKHSNISSPYKDIHTLFDLASALLVDKILGVDTFGVEGTASHVR